ncbi:post-segregation antitoxin (ccd killing protein) [Caballeronia udeis]|uniref:Post-segregation antitoxin (Ccd killing protein) n=1 Tax=Caballeronia udeis TaxID=1232866 RepID=A0ABW8MXB4_9BURK
MKIAEQFPEDLERMKVCLGKARKMASDSDIALAWARYSDGLCASWLSLRGDDNVLTETLLAYLPACAGGPKRAMNVELAESLLAEASDLGIDVSQAAEAGLARAVDDRRAELWQKENTQAIESSNAYVEQHGLPLEKYRVQIKR